MNEQITPTTWQSTDFEPVASCPFCAASDRHAAYTDLEDITFCNISGQFSMMVCDTCGAGYLDPRPVPQVIGSAYAQYYTHGGGHDPQGGRGVLRKIRRALADDYRRRRYGAQTGPAIPGGALLLKALPRQCEVLDAYYRHLPRKKGRLLDFGCGNGAFLRIARNELGWQVEGTDFDPTAVTAACNAGFEVREGGEETLDGIENRYDAVTLSHVIEHVYDPAALMRAVFRSLNPGGMVFVETPNMASLGREVFGRHWRGLEAPRHLGIPSWTSMECLLENAGFVGLERHPRFDTQTPIFQRSAALASGGSSENPAALNQPGPSSEQRTTLETDPSRSEYVTMTATRPA